jgi:hypothetical protein
MVTSPVEIWSRVTLIPPASKVARDGFGPRQLPEAVPAGRGLREQGRFRPADRDKIPGTSTRVTCRVTFRVTSARIMGGTEGRSSWCCKGGTR